MEALADEVDRIARETAFSGAVRVDRGDKLEEEDGVKKLGALAVGGPKMKLQKRCVQRMFESKGTVMDLEGVYEVALEAL